MSKAKEYIQKRYHTLGFSKESTIIAVNLTLEDVEELINSDDLDYIEDGGIIYVNIMALLDKIKTLKL